MQLTGIERLDALNKMLTARNGIVPFDVVFLTGSTRDIARAISMESGIIGEYVKENALADGPGVYITDLKSAKSILSEHKFKTMNIDVTGLAKDFDYENLILELGFDDLTEDMLDEVLNDELREKIKVDRDSVVVETLIFHFEHHTDNKFYKDDFDWFVHKEDKVNITNDESRKEPKAISSFKKKERTVDTSDDTADKKPVHGKGASLFASYRNAPVKKEEIKVTEDSEVDEDEPLKPETVEPKKKPAYVIKDRLSDEEAAKNEEYLTNLRAIYEEGIRFIKETCNSQYRIILNKMQDAVEKNIYKTQYCPLYLEISEDRKTPLYHKLYEIDMATIEFQKKVVHQVIHMGCAFCGNEWDEEITYLSKGPHFVKCPNCYSERPFEKE